MINFNEQCQRNGKNCRYFRGMIHDGEDTVAVKCTQVGINFSDCPYLDCHIDLIPEGNFKKSMIEIARKRFDL